MAIIRDFCVEWMPTGQPKPHPKNARIHSETQVSQIALSINEFGFTNPILVDENYEIIAGHGRLEAAKLIEMKTVPVIVIRGLSSAQKTALRLADNKIAENAGWDLDILADELGSILESDLEIDIGVTGFDVAEVDLIIGAEPGDAEEERVPTPDTSLPTITQPRDIWALNEHRVCCGDAKDPAVMERLMDGQTAAMGITDPPYNVAIDGHVSGKGTTKHRDFHEACGEMSAAEFEGFLENTLGLGAKHSRDGAAWYVCMDWRHAGELIKVGQMVFDAWLNLCVWAKTNGGMGSLYRSQHELVFVFRKGKASHRNNVRLGKYGRNRTNLWTYPGVNTFRPGRMEELTAHPTAKPVAMIQDAILDVSARGDIVLDPFLGAGATVIAAERAGRIAYGLEIDPAYVDIILRRWRDETGREPVRESDNRTLASLEAQSAKEGE